MLHAFSNPQSEILSFVVRPLISLFLVSPVSPDLPSRLAPCPMLYALCVLCNGPLITDDLLPSDLHMFPQGTLETEVSQFFL
jgi:hypothetical protein